MVSDTQQKQETTRQHRAEMIARTLGNHAGGLVWAMVIIGVVHGVIQSVGVSFGL